MIIICVKKLRKALRIVLTVSFETFYTSYGESISIAAVQQELRDQAIRLRKSGMGNNEVARIVGVHPVTTSNWWSRYQKDGKKGIEIGQRGRVIGDKRWPTPKQEALIIRRLIDSTPGQLKFKSVLWTREAVRTLIKHDLDIDMPISTVGDYLRRWEFTSQVPITGVSDPRQPPCPSCQD